MSAPKRPAKRAKPAAQRSPKGSTKPTTKASAKRAGGQAKETAAARGARGATGGATAAATPLAGAPASRVISPAAAATWSAVLPRTSRLMVPIALDALMVRADGGTWADVAMKTPTDDGPDARALLPAPFAEKDGGRTRGAYLHWALPDALTRGVMPDDGSDTAGVQFPAVPDRWLVVRLSPGNSAAQRAVRGWVLLAGGASPVVVDPDAFVEPGPGNDGSADVRAPLTALGHGDPAWAAYFDNVENRLGFHDPLADVTTGPLAYLVCGWHASDALDPLGGPDAQVPAVRLERMRALGWSVAAEDLGQAADHTARTVVAAQALGLAVGSRAAVDGLGAAADAGGLLSLYHGSVVGLGWPTASGGLLAGANGGEVGGPPPASAVDVVIAPTMAEAVAALSTPAELPLQARVVASVAAGAQSVLDTAAGRADVDAALHARAFVSFAGGDATETVWQPPTSPQPTPPGRPPRPLSDAVLAGQATTFTRAAEAPSPPPRPRFEPIAAARRDAPWLRAVTDVRAATLQEVIGGVTPAPPPPPAPGEPGKYVEVKRPLPRFHAPADPVLLVRGARRAFRHGGDGRFTHDGTLACRLSGACVTALSALPPGSASAARVSVRPEMLLARTLDNGSIPAECEDLLREVVLLDPGSAGPAAHALSGAVNSAVAPPPLAHALVVEQTAWWALRERRLDAAPLLVSSGLEGTLPSPVAVTPPVKPWTPLHIDWEAEYLPSPAGERDWSLGEIDLGPVDADVAAPLVIQGRTLLSSGPATLLGGVASETRGQAQRVGTAVTLPVEHRARFASDVAQTLTQAMATLNVAPAATGDAAALADVASRLADSDLLAGALDPLHVDLRGGVPGDGSATTGGGARPSPFIALRAGFLRMRRLRLVDTFGQFVDLAGSDANTPVDPARLRWAGGLTVADRPELGALPPRFTAPARLMLRYTDGAGGSHEADDLVSPVCGFLLPNHLENALEAFDAAGGALGVLGQGDDALVWEETPGQPGTVGRAPERSVPNPFLAGVLRGLLDYRAVDAAADARESALSAFLRLVDSTRWSVDPFAHAGDEHLSLLVGHPVAVLRARVWLEVVDPVAPGEAAAHAVPVRLGSLAEWQDGLYGYYVDDDYRRLHLPDGAAARFARPLGPGQGFLQRIDRVADYYAQFSDDLTADDAQGTAALSHPLIDASGILWLVPGRVVRLTLLVEPHATIHATTGYLPRKSIGMRRRWVTPGLARLAPTFRFGPVLVDPNGLRMPVARDLGGTWSWQSRADVGRWTSEPITNATGEAALSPGRVRATEGWLRLVPDPPADGSVAPDTTPAGEES